MTVDTIDLLVKVSTSNELKFQAFHLQASHLFTGHILQVLLHHDLPEAHLDQPFCALPLCWTAHTETNTFNTFSLKPKNK